jgi:hypothetical protein
MDYEKLLRAYLRHVNAKEGTDFLPLWEKSELVDRGLTAEESQRLIDMGEEENGDCKVS